MATPIDPRELDRRKLLCAGVSAFGGLALLSSRAQGAVRVLASPQVPGAAAQRTLVILQLSGGNDGLSTVVPFAEDGYQRARPTLALREQDVLRLDAYRGLHPQLKRLAALYAEGRLAIVEGAGYPDPVRSHFKSLEVWHTGDARGRASGDGWIGRLCDAAWTGDVDPNLVVHVGPNVPYALHSATHPPVAFVNPASYRWAGGKEDASALEKSGDCEESEAGEKGAQGSNLEYLRRVLADSQASSLDVRKAAARYRTTVEYPADALGAALRDVAALVVGDLGTRVFSVELGGFDTHTNQKNRHEQLMRTLDGGLAAFLADLQRTDAGRATVVVVFSEFGRRIKENGARGTDHGVAAPMFLAGAPIKGGLYGKPPSFAALDAGDLAHTTDFRSVYGTVIERWFAVPQAKVLGKSYPLVACLA